MIRLATALIGLASAMVLAGPANAQHGEEGQEGCPRTSPVSFLVPLKTGLPIIDARGQPLGKITRIDPEGAGVRQAEITDESGVTEEVPLYRVSYSGGQHAVLAGPTAACLRPVVFLGELRVGLTVIGQTGAVLGKITKIDTADGKPRAIEFTDESGNTLTALAPDVSYTGGQNAVIAPGAPLS